jgi:hypothetical protein
MEACEVVRMNAMQSKRSWMRLSYDQTDRNWDGKIRKIRITAERQDLRAQQQYGAIDGANGTARQDGAHAAGAARCAFGRLGTIDLPAAQLVAANVSPSR